MIPLFLIYFFLLGVIIGSFLNVLILRHNTGKTLGGRSACMTCGTPLKSRELVPLFSFLFQRGKCRHCGARISWQYPLVELSTGILFALNFYHSYMGASSVLELGVSFVLTSSIIALMVATFVYDIRHKIIPDAFSFSMSGLGIVYVLLEEFVFRDGQSVTPYLFANLGAGLLFYLGVYALWKFSNGRWIGLGDAKLLLSIGTVLGFVYGLSAIFLSVWIGTAYAVCLMLKQHLDRRGKRITMKSEIAFGPFLILAFLIVYFLRVDVTGLGTMLANFS